MRRYHVVMQQQQLKRQHYQPVPPPPERQRQRHGGQPRHQRRNNRRQLRFWTSGGEVTRHWMRRADESVRATLEVGGTRRAAPGDVLTAVKRRHIGRYPHLEFIGSCAGILAAHQCRNTMLPSASCSLGRLPAYEARMPTEMLRRSLLAQTHATPCVHRLRRGTETSTTTSVVAKFFSTWLGATVDRNLYMYGRCSKYGRIRSVPVWHIGAVGAVHSRTRAPTCRTPPQVDLGAVLHGGSSSATNPSRLQVSPAGQPFVCMLTTPQKPSFCASTYMQSRRSLLTISANELSSVSTQKVIPSQEGPAVEAFSVGTGWGGVLLWLTSFTGLFSGVTYLGKNDGGDRAEEADEAAVRHNRKATDEVQGGALSNNAQHLRTRDEGRRDVASPASRKHTQQDFPAHGKAGGSSPHYPGDTLPSTEVVLENVGFTSIFSATRRQPILVAEKLTRDRLRSSSPSLLQKEFQDLQEGQLQVSSDEEEEIRDEMMQLWGGKSPSEELKEYSANVEERQVGGGPKSQCMLGETALLLSQQQQFPTTGGGDADQGGEQALLTGMQSLRDRQRFVQDSRINPLWSPAPSDYISSGYSRGHMAAAALHSNSLEELRSTFSLGANIVPQLISVNSGVWRRLEALSLYLTTEYDEVFVVSGPLWLPNDIECRWPQVFVVPEEASRSVLRRSSNLQTQKTAEGSENGVATKKDGAPPSVMYTCLRPYKDASAFYAVSHESLTGAASPGPPSSKGYYRSSRSGSFSGSRSSQRGDYIVSAVGGDDPFASNQPLDVGLGLCKKALRNFHAQDWDSTSGSSEATESRDVSPSVRTELRTGDAGEAAEAWKRRRNSSTRDEKPDTREIPRGQEVPLQSILANGNSASESEEEGQYPQLLPGAAVLRGRPQAPAPLLHVAHETIGTRLVSVPTHFYKIILAVGQKSRREFQSGVDGNDATSQRGSRSNRLPPSRGGDTVLPPVVLGAFLVPNKEIKVRKLDLRSVLVPIGFLEFATGLSFQGIVQYATKKVLLAAHEQVREDLFPGNHIGGGSAAPSARVPVLAQ